MKQFADDELTDLVPPTSPVQQAAPPPPPPTPAPQAPPPPVATAAPAPVFTAPAPAPVFTAPPQTAKVSSIEDLDLPGTAGTATAAAPTFAATPGTELVGRAIDFDNAEPLKTGDGLSRIRPAKGSGKPSRFALIGPPPYGPGIAPRAARSHYVPTKDGKRNCICLADGTNDVGLCCTKLQEEGRTHIIHLALEYTNCNPTNGNYPKGYTGPIEWRIGFVDLSPSQFNTLKDKPQEGKSVYDYDYVMVMNGNRYDFNIKSPVARWKLDPEVVKAVTEAVQPFVRDGGVKLAKRLGTKKSILEWKALLSGVAVGAAEASLDDVESI